MHKVRDICLGEAADFALGVYSDHKKTFLLSLFLFCHSDSHRDHGCRSGHHTHTRMTAAVIAPPCAETRQHLVPTTHHAVAETSGQGGLFSLAWCVLGGYEDAGSSSLCGFFFAVRCGKKRDGCFLGGRLTLMMLTITEARPPATPLLNTSNAVFLLHLSPS